jgi:hypothetical protein
MQHWPNCWADQKGEAQVDRAGQEVVFSRRSPDPQILPASLYSYPLPLSLRYGIRFLFAIINSLKYRVSTCGRLLNLRCVWTFPLAMLYGLQYPRDVERFKLPPRMHQDVVSMDNVPLLGVLYRATDMR